MKQKFHANQAVSKVIILITCFLLVMIYNRSKAGDHDPVFTKTSLKKSAVLFKQNADRKELTVLVKADIASPLQLYFFSADGTLIKQIAINKETETTLTDLQKGTYLYQCFSNDYQLQSGKLTLEYK
ncbi:T9SS type A sorting domain-containing protein [Ferruginibacter albus]|uniref:T9SS type A sorting domain-containing protein n=1 Tax=Ferruginibacter albus TaxID=2875540 RepID=UPI001CC6B3F9|nr:T9SS type A sorting domain-containing protein [Ferruginibacter albus]UAY51734.1 T9SS type A sorting domain-containing protein [Ferruginibacter albus]